jgi:hypothetical protein
LGGYLHPKPPCFPQPSKGFVQNPCQFGKNCLRPFDQENLTVLLCSHSLKEALAKVNKVPFWEKFSL